MPKQVLTRDGLYPAYIILAREAPRYRWYIASRHEFDTRKDAEEYINAENLRLYNTLVQVVRVETF